ncbi:hypothetical protein OH76DRAFT_1400893 [Lentinus brumalis]|uniref:Cleavage stimulation factor subunit 2 hinge domain-containing protein n=1 Tax=Lentinus brumalis TaxID=2498619 RepID=A0A371DHJ5_9APHY|nr:hypothetical protein OH76DRAFT_1400893 [Polyporus brumalis]
MAAQEEQLLELLLTLKRTTPGEARTILNSQPPQIAHALMTMMVNINAVKMEVVQEILAKYGAAPGPSGAAQPPALVPPPLAVQQPPSAIPPHMQAQVPSRGGTPTFSQPGPQGGYPPPGYQGGPPGFGGPPGLGRGYGTPPPGPSQVPGFAPSHAPQQPQQPPSIPGMGLPGLAHGPPQAQPPPHMQLPHASQPPPVPGPAPAVPVLPPALAALPEDQKALIMRVVAMSREEVYQMPPADRENIIKLRTTLNLPV